jgi:hypothetical protein
MSDFIKGLALCEGFFNECAKPIIDKYFPDLHYSAGLIGYGSTMTRCPVATCGDLVSICS